MLTALGGCAGAEGESHVPLNETSLPLKLQSNPLINYDHNRQMEI